MQIEFERRSAIVVKDLPVPRAMQAFGADPSEGVDLTVDEIAEGSRREGRPDG